MRIAVLVKQVPVPSAIELLPSGRLRRENVALEMNAYCRRAVSKGVEFARTYGGECVVFTLGPPSADDVLREAIAWGATRGVHLTDPIFAGSDTLATARALASAVGSEGPFDLLLVGRNSLDADTGQVGPEIAELLDLPFVAAVKALEIGDSGIEALCELDDGWRRVRVELPAVVSTAERLTEPCKVPEEQRQLVDASLIVRRGAADLDGGPFGVDGSPTSVGRIRLIEADRAHTRLSGNTEEVVAQTVAILRDRGVLASLHHPTADSGDLGPDDTVPDSVASPNAQTIGVICDHHHERVTRELLGEAALLASRLSSSVVAIGPEIATMGDLASWGADRVVSISGVELESDVARAVSSYASEHELFALLAPSTLWGREIASRVAARIGAGLTGDAVELSLEPEGLICWKPAFGGTLLAAIASSSPTTLATLRPGVLQARRPRAGAVAVTEIVEATATTTISIVEESHTEGADELLSAEYVIGIGKGVDPDAYDEVKPLIDVLGAELGATRKVTDNGWMTHSRQLGITGHSVAPILYVALGISGSLNHTIATRAAGTVLAVNIDPDARVFDAADIGITGDWKDVVPALAAALDREVAGPVE